MLTAIPITDLTAPELQPYRTLRQSVEHFREGVFIAESQKVVHRLIESNLKILSLLMTPEWLEHYRPKLEARSESVPVYVAPKKVLEEIVGYNLHQGIMALGKIPAPPTLETVVASSPRPLLFAALDGLADAENLGAVVRSCCAFGVHGLVVGETSGSPYLRRAVRNSMGTVFKMPVIHCKNLAETLTLLRSQHAITIIAAHPHTEEQTLQTTDCTKDLCIVFGSEGYGISKKILDACDTFAAVPMQLGVDSLNVASASAVFLYEVYRQRTVNGKSQSNP